MIKSIGNEAELIVIGDSHIQVFHTIAAALPFWSLDICEVGGATAQGAVNPNSKTNALSIFKKKLEITKIDSKYIVIQLGEVDCGFVIWYRARKYKESVRQQLNFSVKNYRLFIEEVVMPKFQTERILISSAVPPTIHDNLDPKFLNGARSEVKASINQRTKLTFLYNEAIQKICLETGCQYINIFDHLISKETGIVDDRFRNEDPTDHHLSTRKTASTWIKEISKAMIEYQEF